MTEEIKLFIGWVLVWTVIFLILGMYRYATQLTKNQFMQKLKQIGYDTSDHNRALKTAEDDIALLRSKLSKVEDEATINFSCPNACKTYRDYYRCCEKSKSEIQKKARDKAIAALSQRDQDLMKYYENYTANNFTDTLFPYLSVAFGIPAAIALLTQTPVFFVSW